ncbi:hypothetical protein CoNPh10_CDS0117 [Staphylococcus phage S-CoN_Ph10]|nr:hypothetical protein BE22_0008 [Staphylococcus phage vB_SepS_BE22]WNM53008.1 hypothetical protein CoNPh10_CDS0117 [Staphylococcus phage S-CoN_Ph10]
MVLFYSLFIDKVSRTMRYGAINLLKFIVTTILAY